MDAHFCTNCGGPITPAERFCTACGHPVAEAAATVADPFAGPAEPPEAPAGPPSGPPSGPPGGGPPSGEPAAAQPGDEGRRRLLTGVGIAVVFLLVVALVWALMGRGGKDEASAEVLLEPVGVEVPDPFTSTVAIDEGATSAPTTAPPGSTPVATTTAPQAGTGAGGGVVKGSAPGLYGGTRNAASCDPEKMISFLTDEPAKAKAWAGVQGIEPSEIPTFVRSLTPVVLRRDTRVLNHGYRDGKATPRAAVLQAGTAVLVDANGVPRVKCGCGNPLGEAPPLTTKTTYKGTRWPGFTPSNVVVVRVDVKVTTFVLIDVRTGIPFQRPAGTVGDDDGDAGTATTTSTTTPPGGSEGTSAPVLAEISSIAGTSNGPTAPSVVDLPAARITALVTYHWNSAQGAAPGTIGLRAADGTMYGPYQATGSPGQGGVPNAYWTAVVNVTVPAGSYTVVDSDPASWAWASDTGGRGMVIIHGIAQGGTGTTTTRPRTTTTSEPQDYDRSKEAMGWVQDSFCADPDVEDWRQYITDVRGFETDYLLYRVEVDITLDSGAWTALFDVDFATEDGPDIRPVNSESAALLC